jgi:hypothetical protein
LQLDPHFTKADAKQQARALFRLVTADLESCARIRELIDIPPATRALLEGFIKQHPNESRFVRNAIRLREMLLVEFDRMTEKWLIDTIDERSN